jgi:succinate dehydrogenase / fumarate reductase cytochrome b subunit
VGNNHFFARKLHSLLGVIPVGMFLIFHLIANYTARRGGEAYNKMVQFIEGIPFIIFLEFSLIYIPVLFHAIYGLYIAFQAKNNVYNYGYFRNAMFLLQRISGVITLIFISWHVWETRLQKVFGHEVNFEMMVDILENPFMFAFYVVGIISTVFHFSNGMWSFLVSWGITVGPKAQRISTYVWMVVFVTLSYLGVMSLFAFL